VEWIENPLPSLVPQPAPALWVAGGEAASASLPLLDDDTRIACVAAPRICRLGARNGG